MYSVLPRCVCLPVHLNVLELVGETLHIQRRISIGFNSNGFMRRNFYSSKMCVKCVYGIVGRVDRFWEYREKNYIVCSLYKNTLFCACMSFIRCMNVRTNHICINSPIHNFRQVHVIIFKIYEQLATFSR